MANLPPMGLGLGAQPLEDGQGLALTSGSHDVQTQNDCELPSSREKAGDSQGSAALLGAGRGGVEGCEATWCSGVRVFQGDARVQRRRGSTFQQGREAWTHRARP